ncbi:MAG: sulfoxide reductase heme-binding subunit YedZ [Gammaproteobacteria bacterium]|nr:sulfoxide reductase heme-binding subunit YedZ [Gammaproteobacteria bacterium]NIM72426.1 sulfoxide reductase heme-binding subunit YedZ [Gammaproteobacteria bacterium]NIN37293.1 sulfoxide reductase heme-binding subunit YedZ [Gammaproteobacteria bacterium]NIO24183.1 sulfoxide reductase heme-binding subunit YedZ [Gammaproteobacteria bacterium]NIO64790.1 sulfoxide reductase heme-binding subunit YedZ [Gammaproteobacteria bacterium]
MFFAALVPLALLVWNAFHDGLGANPVETITHETGSWGLRFLLLTLLVTPLRRASGWQALARVRRMLGLFAFFYICLHFLTYVVLDAYFDLHYILEDITDRTYITLGFTSFVLLVPLALTSTNAMVRRLGGRNWRRLHRLAYVAATGGVLHFIWLVKADLREPLIYLGLLLLLFLARVPAIADRLARIRGSSPGESASSARQIAT